MYHHARLRFSQILHSNRDRYRTTISMGKDTLAQITGAVPALGGMFWTPQSVPAPMAMARPV